MKVTLNIADDAELRKSINEAIQGEVRNIVREELRLLVKAELQRKIAADARLIGAHEVTQVITDQAAKMVRELLPPGALTKADLLPAVDRAVDRIFSSVDFAKLVNETATAKITALISPNKEPLR